MFRLKQFRIDKGLKQSDLQKLFSCTQPTISQIENGRIPMPPNFLRILKEKYGDEVSIDYSDVEANIANAIGNSTTAVAGTGIRINGEIDKFLELMKNQDERLKKSQEQIDRLLTIIENLSSKSQETKQSM